MAKGFKGMDKLINDLKDTNALSVKILNERLKKFPDEVKRYNIRCGIEESSKKIKLYFDDNTPQDVIKRILSN